MAPAAEDFPYTAAITAEDVYVRSGPGANYYPTDKLQRGDTVEVYRHDPGGWCAIRPPKNSFSWIAAQKLTAAGNELAAANEDRVVVRVGSTFSDIREVIQVRLDKGERVEVMSPPPGDDPMSGWYKIAPPAGEFRWISAKFILRRETIDGSGERDADGGTKSRTAAASGSKPGFKSGKYPGERELDRLDLELSAIAAEDISRWQFDSLKHRAEAVLDDADTAVERGRARLFLTKVARFEDIKLRSDRLNYLQHGGSRGSMAQAGGAGAAGGERAAVDPRYDGSGRLMPIAPHKPGAPPYALTNAKGDVLQFISPAPGINLQPFVNKQIGVNGQVSVIPDLNKQIINVQRVALIDQGRTY